MSLGDVSPEAAAARDFGITTLATLGHEERVCEESGIAMAREMQVSARSNRRKVILKEGQLNECIARCIAGHERFERELED